MILATLYILQNAVFLFPASMADCRRFRQEYTEPYFFSFFRNSIVLQLKNLTDFAPFLSH